MSLFLPLTGLRLAPGGGGRTGRYARALLESLGADLAPARGRAGSDEHPALAWRRSGLMALTGQAGGAARMCPLPLTACADGALGALAAISQGLRITSGSGAALLGMRARLAGLARGGATSPGGTCRLLACRDGHLAINLARPDDWAMVPAWLEIDTGADWATVAARVAGLPATPLLDRARLLGLAAARSATSAPCAWFGLDTIGTTTAPRPRQPEGRGPLVIDLSSLWAGPLCAQLLAQIGARVIKVESTARPDGARSGPPAFFHRLNAGKASVRLDLATPSGRDRLRQLIDRADIVIEASRPRALRQMGINAEAWLAGRSGRTWLSITGHGRQDPAAHWVAFGDDAGVGAGLSALMYRATGEQLICGDAIGDPMTGLHAALATWASWRAGGGHLLSLSLDAVLRHCAHFDAPASDEALHERQARWTHLALVHRPAERAACLLPRGRARAPGADTAAVLSGLRLGIP